jgi:hypothetical protein
VREKWLTFVIALFIVAPPFLVQVLEIQSPHLRSWRMFSSAGFDAYRLKASSTHEGQSRAVSLHELFEGEATPCFDEPQISSWCEVHPNESLYLFLQCGQAADRWRLEYDGKQDLCSH